MGVVKLNFQNCHGFVVKLIFFNECTYLAHRNYTSKIVLTTFILGHFTKDLINFQQLKFDSLTTVSYDGNYEMQYLKVSWTCRKYS